MVPGTHDFSVVRGTSAEVRELSPLILRFSQDDIPVVFDEAILSVFKKAANELKGVLLFRASTADDGPGRLELTDEYSSEVSWMSSEAQTRELLVSALNYYEVELRFLNSKVVYILGSITGIGGLNADDAES